MPVTAGLLETQGVSTVRSKSSVNSVSPGAAKLAAGIKNSSQESAIRVCFSIIFFKQYTDDGARSRFDLILGSIPATVTQHRSHFALLAEPGAGAPDHV